MYSVQSLQYHCTISTRATQQSTACDHCGDSCSWRSWRSWHRAEGWSGGWKATQQEQLYHDPMWSNLDCLRCRAACQTSTSHNTCRAKCAKHGTWYTELSVRALGVPLHFTLHPSHRTRPAKDNIAGRCSKLAWMKMCELFGCIYSRLLVNYVNYVPILWRSSWPVHELAKHVYLLQVWGFSDHGSVCSISKELLENIKKIQSPPLLMLLGCDCRSSGSA